MKTKNYIFIGIITIISLVIYMIAMGLSSLGGALGHSISPGVFGLIAGVIFVYICYHYPVKGIFTVYTIVLLLFFSLMGGAYLPWIITSIIGGICADMILNHFGFDKLWPQMSAWAAMQLGGAAGQWIPIWFFTQSFREEWMSRGQQSTMMDDKINAAIGVSGILSVLLVCILPCIGVLIGRKILKKYRT